MDPKGSEELLVAFMVEIQGPTDFAEAAFPEASPEGLMGEAFVVAVGSPVAEVLIEEDSGNPRQEC